MVYLKRCRIVVVVIPVLLMIIGMVAFVASRRALEQAAWHTCRAKIIDIETALFKYHARYGHFPMASDNSRFKHRYSWRVAILPFLGRQDLYDRYKFDEPWDSPTNKDLIKMIPDEYHCHSAALNGMSDVAVIVDEYSAFPPDRYTRTSDVSDSQSQTILVVQFPNSNIPWTEPRDLSLQELTTKIKGMPSSLSHPDRIRFGTLAFSVNEFTGEEEEELLRALITISKTDNSSPFFAP